MSELGNIKDSYGKQISIGVANTFGDTLLKSNVPSNMLIISSPVNSDNTDIGTPCIFASDINGETVRLSYSIQPGNGLIKDTANPDSIALHIDNSSICVNSDNQLYINTANIVGTNVSVESDKLYINTQTLPEASENTLGIVSLDDTTIKLINDTIYVETENLDRANETQYGVVKGDNNTIKISDDGIVSVVTDNLQKASVDTQGVSKVDKTFTITDDTLSVSVDNLTHASATTTGVAKCDNTTIQCTNGVLSVNQTNLTDASDSQYGLVQPDATSLVVTNGILSVNKYDDIVSSTASLKTKIDTLKNYIFEIDTLIENGVTFDYSTPTIFDFICTGVNSTALTKATYGTFASDLKAEKVTAEFKVNTNCPFTISVDYIDNVAPQVHLYSINYDDIQTYNGQEGLKKQFQSTEQKDKLLRFSFICKNYANSVSTISVNTKIKITISYIKDNTVSKTATYHIVRYNSLWTAKKIDNLIISQAPDGRTIL